MTHTSLSGREPDERRHAGRKSSDPCRRWPASTWRPRRAVG